MVGKILNVFFFIWFFICNEEMVLDFFYNEIKPKFFLNIICY